MANKTGKKITSDFLIIGSGVAGLSYALKVAKYGTVSIVTKKGLAESNTNYAQGGIASVFDKKDSFDSHIKDTLEAGDGLCDEKVVKFIVESGPERIKELINIGVNFNKEKDSKELSLVKEGGHTNSRIVFSDDVTGHEVEKTLITAVRKNKNITIYENCIAIDLICLENNTCVGAYVLNKQSNQVVNFISKITLLATGGCGKVYLYTSNPDIATGDGIAMAYRAGANIANLEFMQFHPTCLYHNKAKRFLISETVRGEGGKLFDKEGRAFMHKYNEKEELACRDKVAKAIDTELKKSGDDCVFLDISHRDKDFIKKRFPNLYKKCFEFGIDMTKEPIPVVPAAHYMCGGIKTDTFGATNIRNLFAIGESACTGVHGANRLASNSILEAIVISHKSAQKSIKQLETTDLEVNAKVKYWDDMNSVDSDEEIMVSHNWDEIRRIMWNYVGIVRSDKRLERAKRRIKNLKKEIYEYYWDFKITSNLIELRNLALVADLIIKCASKRKESRGLHYNILYPLKSKKFEKDTVIKKRK